MDIAGTPPVSAAAQSAALEAQSLGAGDQPKPEAKASPARKTRAKPGEEAVVPRHNGLSGKRAWITLHDSERVPPTGQFIGINGVGFMLLPGIRASVPVELMDVLNDAVQTEPVLNDRLQIDGHRSVPRLTYTFHGLVE